MGVVGGLRARLHWVVAVVALSTLAADSAVLADRQHGPLLPRAPRVPVSVALAEGTLQEPDNERYERERARDEAVKAMFGRRADAVLKRDANAFMADLDGADAAFVARQREVFDSLGKLDFATWEYRLRDDEYSVTSIDWRKYGRTADVALPVLTLHYQLKGYDRRPVVRRVVYTVVRRGDRWLIANDRDLQESTSSGTSVRRDPWENGPITVAKSKNGLVIGHPDDADAIKGIQKEVESAIRHVSSYVGKAWGEKTVVILPSDHEELQYILENPDVPFEFAAIAHPEFTTLDEDYLGLFAGTRVVINPENFNPSSSFNRLLIRHELTHVALFERTGPLSPRWLVEGIAEWVGNAGSDLPTPRLAPSLADLVEEDGVPDYLPLDSDFGIIGDAGVGYESGWMLCRYIASRYGRDKLLRLYVEMGTREGLDKPGQKFPNALREVLGTDEAALLKAWRPYVRAALGDPVTLLSEPGTGYSEGDTARLDTTTFAKNRGLKAEALRNAGMERAAEGFWYAGSAESPSRIVSKIAIVSRDQAGAAALAKVLGQRYTKFDTGTPIPNGRLYLVGVTIGDKDYNQGVAVITAGIVTYEIRVAHEAYGDPSAEARRQAAAQFAAAGRV
jgi:hypothetical protein